jgi:hypothetical protein
MQPPRYIAVAALVLGLAHVTAMGARAQEADTLPRDSFRWAAGPYVGGFWIEDKEMEDIGMTADAGVIFGARVTRRFDNPHWEAELGFGYGPLSAESDAQEAEIDGNLFTYHGAVGYLAPARGKVRFRLTGGVGAMYYSYDEFSRLNEAGDDVDLIDTSWANEFVILLGAGVEFDAGERIAFRVDARDHVQFCRAEDQPINETEDFSHCPLDDTVLSNPEFTVGLMYRFGPYKEDSQEED